MGQYSLTLLEVLEIPNFKLYDDDIQMVDFDGIKRLIEDEFCTNEINYETPDLFKRKLNHALRTRANVYNKMLRAQLIEFDPFVTEYIESYGAEKTNSHKRLDEITNDRISQDINTVSNKNLSDKEDYTSNGKAQTKVDNVGVILKGKLLSESDNKNVTEISNKDNLVDTIKEIDTDTVETSKQDTTTQDTTIKSENITYEEDKKVDYDRDTESETIVNINNNQTARNWSENGDSQGHNLDVHSDTPVAMLFNEPNNYYGTGRAHDYGKVTQDQEGNNVYTHYPETEPQNIDRGSYQIGSGDTPWFNYASMANNKTGHEGYNKSGTETYARDESQNHSFTEHRTDTTNQNIDGSKDIHTDTNRDINDSIIGNKTVTEKEKEKENKVENEKIEKSVLDSTAKNSQENVKEDNSNSEVKSELQDNSYNKIISNVIDTYDNTDSKKDREVVNNVHEDKNENVDRNSTKKGRSMRSPSNLLMDYRKTLTFNADLWLLSELRPLFLQIY